MDVGVLQVIPASAQLFLADALENQWCFLIHTLAQLATGSHSCLNQQALSVPGCTLQSGCSASQMVDGRRQQEPAESLAGNRSAPCNLKEQPLQEYAGQLRASAQSQAAAALLKLARMPNGKGWLRVWAGDMAVAAMQEGPCATTLAEILALVS